MTEGLVSGKVALVTGGGSGIGEAVAIDLAREGATVVVADVVEESASRVAKAIGEGASVEVVDVSDAGSVQRMIDNIVAGYGRLDIAVNNAGIGGPAETVGEYPLDGWRKVLSINLDGVFYGMRYEIPAMLQTGGGSIVNMASILGSVGFATAAGSATRAGAATEAARGVKSTLTNGEIRPIVMPLKSAKQTIRNAVTISRPR